MASCPHPDVWRLAPPHRRAALRRFVRQGVPEHSRAQMWRLWSGADEAAAASPKLFGLLAEQGERALRSEDLKLLRVDLPRTPVPANLSAESLQRLLFAFVARRDLDVGGYTQGMNFNAAFVLGVMREEQPAFWALVRLSESVGLFAHDMSPLGAELGVLDALVAARLPRLAAKMAEIALPLEAIAARWLLCCGLGALSPDTALALWDAILFEEWVEAGGGLATLHASVLALLGARVEAALAPSARAFDVAELLFSAGEALDARAMLEALYPRDDAQSAHAIGGCAHPPPLPTPAATGCGCERSPLGGLRAPLCPLALAKLRRSTPMAPFFRASTAGAAGGGTRRGGSGSTRAALAHLVGRQTTPPRARGLPQSTGAAAASPGSPGTAPGSAAARIAPVPAQTTAAAGAVGNKENARSSPLSTLLHKAPRRNARVRKHLHVPPDTIQIQPAGAAEGGAQPGASAVAEAAKVEEAHSFCALAKGAGESSRQGLRAAAPPPRSLAGDTAGGYTAQPGSRSPAHSAAGRALSKGGRALNERGRVGAEGAVNAPNSVSVDSLALCIFEEYLGAADENQIGYLPFTEAKAAERVHCPICLERHPASKNSWVPLENLTDDLEAVAQGLKASATRPRPAIIHDFD
ncbi:rab-GTPase-TBC domain-containing protein [Pavlovales sp. CCMP2436]|nr:rab-GTPase-TBC domain-containing protein [Pavlovales sp. CCMP2436]